ncbi:hypothetical protein C8Q80DRAFT_1274844 [Daedaleopsis nitida]|nr:hypothetical protein C8Q80DRAFT_1274844 [Daedaleopsis nitida]
MSEVLFQTYTPIVIRLLVTHFPAALYISPTSSMSSSISVPAVFAYNSQNPQMPVETQVAITLYRFGHYGNAASLQKVADWAGCGKGTVELVTQWVMTAILRPEFLAKTIWKPTAEEKERAKAWVATHLCKEW